MHHRVLASTAALALAACSRLPGRSAAATTTTTTLPGMHATVRYVVDGDTVDLMIDGHDERVRLIGINTPESVERDHPVECFGKEASAYTTALLPEGTDVLIERDVEPRDDYGRLLLYVYRAEDGLFVNLDLARAGYAQPLTIPPNVAHSSEFVEAARSAESADVGLWAACSG